MLTSRFGRLLTVLCLLQSICIPASAADSPDVGSQAAPLPDDAALEAAGAKVGAIIIRPEQIFDLSDPRENRALYRLANRLHIRTREATVRAQLLFRSGEPYSRRLLEETERNLRELSFLREPRVRPVRFHDGVVDIEVETHDVWTLQLGPSFARSGGESRSSLSFEDTNLLGRGKTLTFEVSEDVDRNATSFGWRDPSMFGSRWQDSFYFSDASDGHSARAAVWRPFYALNVRRAYGLSLSDSALTDTRYRLGEPYDDYRRKQRGLDAWTGWSKGLRSGYAQRLTLGWRVAEDRFAVSPTGSTRAPLPADRQLSYPYLRLDWVRDHFHTTRNLELIDRTEDLHFGLSGMVQLGWTASAFGGDRSAALFEAAAGYGEQVSEQQQWFVNSSFSTRVEHGRTADQHFNATAAWYLRTSPRTLLHVRATAGNGHELDLDRYYELGGNNGLRGYPLRYQLGTGRTLLKVEQRLYTDWSLWRLLDVGGAAFFDAGRVWGNNPVGAPNLGWLKDVGLGLRLGNSRSSLGNVIHIDLATPLDGESDLDRLQLLISTEASF